MNTRRWLFFLYYLTCAGLVAIAAGKGSWVSAYRLATEGVETRAQLTEASCGSSSPLVYRFAAEGKSYEGRGYEGYGNPPCESLKVGDQLQVYYIPGRPDVNQPGNAADRLGRESAAIAMAALFLPLVLIFFVFLLRRLLFVRGAPK